MAGVYVHIPFCQKRCLYCDFYSTTQLALRQDYIKALLREIAQRRDEIKEPIRTIYFGGGTPSQLEAKDIVRLLKSIGKDDAEEITIEVNPGDCTLPYLQELRQAGINRLSMGIQSFHDERLRLIGRRHTASQAREAFGLARKAGFENLSIDLMYGLPGQTMEEWQEDIEAALLLHPEHMSAYCLQWEEGTQLMAMRKRGEITKTDDEVEMEMFDCIMERLSEAGYEHYEVSNYALPGLVSRHNSSYWNDTPYIGIGAAAHSYDGQVRSSNPSDIIRYIQGAQREEEILTEQDKYNEHVMLSLRTAKGLPRKDIYDQAAVERMIQQGWLREQNENIVATGKGLHILNSIIETLMI